MFEAYSYHLPFKEKFLTGSESYSKRSGFILQYSDGSTDALSESAPLPGFSQDSFVDVRAAILQNKVEINSFFSSEFTTDQISDLLSSLPPLPSLHFGLSALAVDLLCQRKNSTVHELLNTPFHETLSVNAVMGRGSDPNLFSKIDELVKKRFSTFKFKVGNVPKNLSQNLRKIHQKYPHLTFRLDANGSWSEENLESFSKYFAGLPIEYIEEPIHIKSPAELALTAARCQLPLALDESVQNTRTLQTFAKIPGVEAWIIKPMLFGNIFSLSATLSGLKSLHNRVVVTTLLETAVGRRTIGILAGCFGAQNRAHGLNTGSLLTQDLMDEQWIQDGKLEQKPSIGYGLRFKQLNTTHLNIVG